MDDSVFGRDILACVVVPRTAERTGTVVVLQGRRRSRAAGDVTQQGTCAAHVARAGEAVGIDRLHILAERYFGQFDASGKRVLSDRFRCIGEGDFGQFGAFLERVVRNGHHSGAEIDRREGRAARKRVAVDLRDGIGQGYGGQFGVLEHVVADFGHTLLDSHADERCAGVESVRSVADAFQ